MARTLATSYGEVIIRAVQPADASAYRELRLDALKNHPTAFGSDYTENAARPPEYWAERVRLDDEKEALFVAEQAGRLLGMTGIYRSLSPRARHAGTVWGVYVRDGWRGAHIAEELITECLEWARRKSMVIARLGVSAENRSAIRCYERCGFRIYGTERKAIFHEERYIDEHFMDRDL